MTADGRTEPDADGPTPFELLGLVTTLKLWLLNKIAPLSSDNRKKYGLSVVLMFDPTKNEKGLIV